MGFSFFFRSWVFFGLGGGGGGTQVDFFFFAGGGDGGGGLTLGSPKAAGDGDGLTLGSWVAAGDGGSTLGLGDLGAARDLGDGLGSLPAILMYYFFQQIQVWRACPSSSSPSPPGISRLRSSHLSRHGQP